ncbi:MAG: anti-adapter protein iraM [Klebsiella michiganensis]|nr:anti-adapter protein iraM [Klebsiella michiganensis]
MQWNIENSLVCPVTGTGFSVAASAKNLKLIICQNEVLINGEPGDLQVIHAFPYTEILWSTFARYIDCPGNENPMLLICHRRSLCKFALCPYGARQKRPE